MSTFTELQKFISEDMRMSQVYQPLMLMELLKNGGEATVTQIEYFTEIVKNMVGRVLTKNRGITSKSGNTYKLTGSEALTPDQAAEVIDLFEERIQDLEGDCLFVSRQHIEQRGV